MTATVVALTALLLVGACSDDAHRDDFTEDLGADLGTDVGVDGSTDDDVTSGNDAGGDASVPDDDADMTVDEDVLVVQASALDPTSEVRAVLGRGDDIRVEPLDENGEARFVEPGPGPYTVTLLEPGANVAVTWAQAPGPLVRFERAQLGGMSFPDTSHPVVLSGAVTGTAAGNEVTVELLADGEVYDRMTVDAGSYAFDTSDFGLPEGGAVHLAVLESTGSGPVAIGIHEVTDRLTGPIDQELDISADVVIDHQLEVRVSNRTTTEPVRAGVEFVLAEGTTYQPFFSTALTDDIGAVNVPEPTGSLAAIDGLQLRVGTNDSHIRLLPHQSAIEPLEAPLPSDLDVELLAQPTFQTDVGTNEPVEHEAEGFSLDFDSPAGIADPQWLIARTASNACEELIWVIALPTTASSFTPFELGGEIDFAGLPLSEPLDLSLVVSSDDGTRSAGSEGSIRLTGDSTCTDPVPAWLEGEFVGIGIDGQAFVDDSRIRVGTCGRFRYDIDGGDFAGQFCGQVAESDGSFELVADDSFRFFFNGVTEAEVREASPAFQGLDGLEIVHPMTSETAVFVRRPDPQPAALGQLLPGSYDGVSVTYTIHADASAVPGSELATFGPFAADGSEQDVGTYGVWITDDAEFLEQQMFQFAAILYRQGVVTAFDGTTGSIALTNGPGIVTDLDNTLDVERAASGDLTVVSVREVTDIDDADGDGDSTDVVFEATRLAVTPAP